MNPFNSNNRRAAVVSCTVAVFALGCTAETGGDTRNVSTEHRVNVTDASGNSRALTLLPGSSVSSSGDAHYLVRALNRVLAVDRVAEPKGAQYLEVREGQALLGAAELDPKFMLLRGPGGQQLYSDTGNFVVELATTMVEPLALALLDGRTVAAFDAALNAERSGPELVGTSTEPLQIGGGGFGEAGSSCHNSVPPTTASCTCKVGERCVSTVNSCYCEAATKVGFTWSGAIF